MTHESTNPEIPSQAQDKISAFNEAIATGAVPTIEGLREAAQLDSQITTDGETFNDASGNQLDKDAAEQFRHNTDVSTWMLDKKSHTELSRAVLTNNWAELTDSQKNEARKFDNPKVIIPPSELLRRYKQDATSRLQLSEALHQVITGKEQPTANPTPAERQEAAIAKRAARKEAVREGSREKYFASVAKDVSEFAKSDERPHAAGPDIRKATGVTPEEFTKLNFGSYKEFEAAAITWQAAKDAERAAQVYTAKLKAHDEAYRTEMDASRQARAAAKIEARKSAADAGDRESYFTVVAKDVADFAKSQGRRAAAGPDIRKATGVTHEEINKLNFGSYADFEAAAVQWQRENGAGTYKVPRNQAAEARANEMATFLKDFYKGSPESVPKPDAPDAPDVFTTADQEELRTRLEADGTVAPEADGTATQELQTPQLPTLSHGA